MKLILDSNFLIYTTKYKLWDQLSSYKLVVLPEVIYELKNLEKKSKGKTKESLKLTLEILKKQKVKTRSKKGYADKKIIDLLKKQTKTKTNYILASMDKELIKKAKPHVLGILKIKQKKYLEMA